MPACNPRRHKFQPDQGQIQLLERPTLQVYHRDDKDTVWVLAYLTSHIRSPLPKFRNRGALQNQNRERYVPLSLDKTISIFTMFFLWFTLNMCIFLCIDIPPLGTYQVLSDFENKNRASLPKTHYYSFGLSATREQVNKCYNPNENSPRCSEAKKLPGPGEYKYKNYTTGTGGRHFSFLKRTRNSQGK